MKISRTALPVVIIAALIVFAWLWWNRPQKVDMAAYVPAESLVYLEANSLPEIASAVVATDAWKALAPAAGIKSNLGQVGWWAPVAAWTGIGSAEAVVIARAQVAVAVLSLDADEGSDTLKIKPRAALVFETHTNESRTRAAVEKRVGEFARHAYSEPNFERRTVNGAEFMIWSAKAGERRIVAAVVGSVAVVGNDESAVDACLAVRRAERASLAGNAQVEEMRRRVGGHDALAFGYVSQPGAARLFEVAATAFASQIPDARAQSLAASLLPQMANKILGPAAWSARQTRGVVEDRYFFSLQNGVAARLREALKPSPTATLGASDLLPAGTHSISRYNQLDPAEGWRGLKRALSSQLDAMSSGVVSLFLDAALKPYGIDEPNNFLRAIGPEIVTARLDDSGESTVTIVEVRDEKTLRDFVAKRLGARPRTERIGDANMLVARDEERGAASFVAGHLLMGAEANVRRCLDARAQAKSLAGADAFKRASLLTVTAAPPNALTYTDDEETANALIAAVASQRIARAKPPDAAAMDRALRQLPYYVTETRFIEGGLERTTLSSFGQFGTIVTQFTFSSQ